MASSEQPRSTWEGAQSEAREVLITLDGVVRDDLRETEVNQMAVLLLAFDKFRERNAKRHDLWKEFGTEDSALQLRSKAARIALTLRPDLEVSPEDVEDDAIDAVNYAVFFYRNTHGF